MWFPVLSATVWLVRLRWTHSNTKKRKWKRLPFFCFVLLDIVFEYYIMILNIARTFPTLLKWGTYNIKLLSQIWPVCIQRTCCLLHPSTSQCVRKVFGVKHTYKYKNTEISYWLRKKTKFTFEYVQFWMENKPRLLFSKFPLLSPLWYFLYTTSQNFGHTFPFTVFFLYFYYFLHCRYILKTSNIWSWIYGM